MISKERMEELIEQGATIYDIFRGDIYPVNLLSLIKYGDIGFEYHNDYYHCDIYRTLSDFYETREDAEWEQEFGRIIRTERLELPTWEELNKPHNIIVDFINKDTLRCNMVVENYERKITINGVGGCYNIWDLTKENYTLACRKCKELFLGDRYE